MNKTLQTDIVVIGAGPGGYTAAFRAADLDKKVTIIDKESSLGGVCLNRGCIPSKALLHLSKLINDAKKAEKKGVFFGPPKININKIREWKNSIVDNLSLGIKQLSRARNITVIKGQASFKSENEIIIEENDKTIVLSFKNAIIATGSISTEIPFLPKTSKKILYSRQALEILNIPKKILVVGCGYIGLEMGTVYSSLGSKVSMIEALPGILDGVDRDLVKPLQEKMTEITEKIYLETKIISARDIKGGGIEAVYIKNEEKTKEVFDAILVSVGRKPNTMFLNLKKANIETDTRGFIVTNNKQQTTCSNIYAIGDVTGNPMLAHKAGYEGVVAAENIVQDRTCFDARAIPAVVFTDPEIAWAGLTEIEAKSKSIPYKKGVFPWVASGRAATMDNKKGKTKVLFDPKTKQILGAGIVGPGAGELISEAVLAIEMGADAEDISMTIHPHPTLSESVKVASEMFLGTATDLYIPNRRKPNEN